MKKTLILILIGLLLTVSAAQAGDLDAVKSAGVLQFGVSPDKTPFSFYNADEDLTGIDIALMEEIASRMGVKLEVTEMSSDDLIESMAIGQVDVVGGAFSKTASRQETIDFTKIYYMAEAIFIAQSNTDLPEPLKPESFSGKKVGVMKNSGFEEWLRTELGDKGYVLKKDIYTYDKMEDAMRALDRGRIDLALMDFSLYQARYQKDSDYRVFEYGDAKDSYAFGLRKNSDLKAEINKYLSAILKDGTAQMIADKFFTMEEPEAESMIQWTAKKATPTPAPTALPTSPITFPAAATAVPTAAPAAATCNYTMSYVADVTIPDGQPISAGDSFTKTWRLKNTGNCAWGTNFMFVFVSGEQMNGANRYLPYPVNPGETVDISVDMIAPSAGGTYQGYWQLRTPQGYAIGFNIWVKIYVPGAYSGSYSYDTPAPEYYYPTAVSYPTAVPTAVPTVPHANMVDWSDSSVPVRTLIAVMSESPTPMHIYQPIYEIDTSNIFVEATLSPEWQSHILDKFRK